MIRRLTLLPLLAVTACNLAPHYRVPVSVALPADFKAAPGWVPAVPADGIAKGQWWLLWNDPVLTALEARVDFTNQNVAAARAAYEQARAVVAQDRAALFPQITATGGVTRSGTFAGNTTVVTTGATTTTTGTTGAVGGTTTTGSVGTVSAASGYGRATDFSAQIGATWQPDLFGRLGNGVRQARAQEQASAADLANATLAAQTQLASDYFALRGADAEIVLLDETIAAYERALAITRNKYTAGTVSRADVETAQTQLSNARIQRTEQGRLRATYEDAVAVMVGENPSTYHLAAAPWAPQTPDVPGVIPSDVLERRPDIAAAERAVAAANVNVGIQRAGYFPSLSLTGDVGASAGTLGDLFTAAASFWSIGANIVQTVFDFGATRARVRQARAAYDQAVATYRQTVLTAFQQVEDELAGVGAARAETADAQTAADAARRAEAIANNQYIAGITDYTAVTAARATALSARENLIQNVVTRQSDAVALIAAIGGEWQGGVELNPK